MNDIIDQYMNGYCMFLAAALHHEYKFPISILTIVCNGVERLCHAWVVLPDGMAYDIQGKQSFKKIITRNSTSNQKYNVYSPTTLEHLEKLSGIPLPVNDNDVKEALFIFQKRMING